MAPRWRPGCAFANNAGHRSGDQRPPQRHLPTSRPSSGFSTRATPAQIPQLALAAADGRPAGLLRAAVVVAAVLVATQMDDNPLSGLIGPTALPTLTPSRLASPTPPPTMRPVCTPPPCEPNEVYFCPGDCPGGCGTTCATPTPGSAQPATEPPPTKTSPTRQPVTRAPTVAAAGPALTGFQQLTDYSLYDDFSSAALGWEERDDGTSVNRIVDQAYSIHVVEPGFMVWTFPPADFQPTAIEYDAWAVPGREGATFGVICHYQDADHFDFVEIDLAGRNVLFGRYGDNGYQALRDWQETTALNPGPNDINHLTLACDPDMLILWLG